MVRQLPMESANYVYLDLKDSIQTDWRSLGVQAVCPRGMIQFKATVFHLDALG